MKKIILYTLMAGIILSLPITLHAVAALNYYRTDQKAHEHCPADTVVWLNIPTHIYHYRTEKWYGNTIQGAYVCKKEADLTGNRPSKRAH